MDPIRTAVATVPDIGRCFNDAMAVYKKNFLALFLAAILHEILSLTTLLILAGPLSAGVCLMTLRALRREDKTVELGDLFGAFGKFVPLVGLFFLTFLLSVLGLFLLLLPGLALMTIWLFPFYLVVDQDLGVFESLKASKDIVMHHGFWTNFLLVLISLALAVGPLLVPYVGGVIGWLLAPLGWLIITSAYLQQAEEQKLDLDGLHEAIRPVL